MPRPSRNLTRPPTFWTDRVTSEGRWLAWKSQSGDIGAAQPSWYRRVLDAIRRWMQVNA